MNWLLGRRYAPITNSAGVLQAEAKATAEELQAWQSGLNSGYSFSIRAVKAGLEAALSSLVPLSTFPRRVVFIPTTAGSTVLFDNFVNGSDVAGKVKVLSKRLAVRGIRITAVPHTISASKLSGSYGACTLEVFQGGQVERAIWAANDGGKWTSGVLGTPFNFEDLSAYESRRVSDRFPPELLREYLRHLACDVFAPELYSCGPDNPAYIVEKEGPASSFARDFSIAEVQSGAHRSKGASEPKR